MTPKVSSTIESRRSTAHRRYREAHSPTIGSTVDPLALRAWLVARSIARGLPQPVADFGGYRVDTNSAAETRRWVFPRVGAGLIKLARLLDQSRHLLKLCGSADELRAALPDRWQLHEPRHFMVSVEETIERPLSAGYTADVERNGAIVAARIKSGTGELVASGYAAETCDAFVCDRVTAVWDHRRRGLASAVMAVLRQAKRCGDTPELLVATGEGQALYTAVGWRVLSPYSTAALPDPSPCPDCA